MKEVFWIFAAWLFTLYIFNLPFEIMYGEDFHKSCEWCNFVVIFGSALAVIVVGGIFYDDIIKGIKESEKKASITNPENSEEGKKYKLYYGRLDAWCNKCRGFTSHKVDEYKPGYGHLECSLCGKQELNERLNWVVERDEDKDRSIRGVKRGW